MRRLLLTAVIVLVAALLPAGPAHATVYSWRDGDGAYHFTNQAEDVPPGELDGYRTFTEPPVAQQAAPAASADPPPADDPPAGYEQGFAAGLRMGEEQIRIAGELAREASQPAAAAVAAPVVYAPQPAPVVIQVAPADGGCGWWGGCGYGYGYTPWFVGPALFGRPFFGRPFFGRGRFTHGGHRFGGHAMFAGGFGRHGGGFGGRR